MHDQPERHQEIRQLSKRLGRADGTKAVTMLCRIDHLVSEAAEVGKVETRDQAIASLEIALDAMGTDREAPLQHERLIMQAIGFLQGLPAISGISAELFSPATGFGALLLQVTGMA